MNLTASLKFGLTGELRLLTHYRTKTPNDEEISQPVVITLPEPRSNREYSSNPNTMRVRARKARLTDYQRELEQSKAADSKAVTRAWKIRANEDTFKMADLLLSNRQERLSAEAAHKKAKEDAKKKEEEVKTKARDELRMAEKLKQ
ncbi:hypothetical protein Hte_005156 [Hypoxylon texense]